MWTHPMKFGYVQEKRGYIWTTFLWTDSVATASPLQHEKHPPPPQKKKWIQWTLRLATKQISPRFQHIAKKCENSRLQIIWQNSSYKQRSFKTGN